MEKVIRNECIILDCFEGCFLPYEFRDRWGPEFDWWYKKNRPDYEGGSGGWGLTGPAGSDGFTSRLYLNSKGRVVKEYINSTGRELRRP